jgi:hypothetical protein
MLISCKNWGEMPVTDMIFGRWELDIADNVYIRNGRGTDILVSRLTILISDKKNN